jgi:Ion channel
MKASLSDICKRFMEYVLGDKGLTAFLVLLFLALFLGPFIDSAPVRMLTSLFLSLLMVAGVATMTQRMEARSFAGLVAFAAIVLRWMTHIDPTPAILRWSSLASLIFMVLLTLFVLHNVFMDDKPVTGHRIRGAIAAYLLFGITWSILYGLLDQMLPQAFSISVNGGAYDPERKESLIFFSFVTLTTVGYGDITPTHDISRMFAVMEALVGQLYPATLLARLVSLEVSHRSRQGGDDS